MHMHNATRLFLMIGSLIATNINACRAGWAPEPPMERIHLVYRVGEKFVIGSPDSTDDFCHWRFIFYESDNFYSDKQGIDFLNNSGIIKFKKHKYVTNYHTLELKSYYDCRLEDQHLMVFKGIRPGRVIFYLQNKPSWQYQHPSEYFYGCLCSPTIREFVIDII